MDKKVILFSVIGTLIILLLSSMSISKAIDKPMVQEKINPETNEKILTFGDITIRSPYNIVCRWSDPNSTLKECEVVIEIENHNTVHDYIEKDYPLAKFKHKIENLTVYTSKTYTTYEEPILNRTCFENLSEEQKIEALTNKTYCYYNVTRRAFTDWKLKTKLDKIPKGGVLGVKLVFKTPILVDAGRYLDNYFNFTSFFDDYNVTLDPVISSCAVLDQENATYYLSADILNSQSDVCLNISANNIVLDCQNHKIDGIYETGTDGIKVDRVSNVIVKNCVVSDWYNGIRAYISSKTSIESSTAENNQFGFVISGSSQVNITNSLSYNNSFAGVFVGSSSNCEIYDNTVRKNKYGIYLVSDSSNKIYENIIDQSTTYGLYLQNSGSSPNTIYNNLINNSVNIYFANTIYQNYWNVTKRLGTRIYSSGPLIGGNFWAKPDGNGYSQTCSDADRDGFCDNAYTVNELSSNYDYLPLSDEYYNTPPEIVDAQYPENTTYTAGKEYRFNITISDYDTVSDITEVKFEFNGVNETVDSYNQIDNYNIEYYVIKSDLPAGTYSYKWYVTDSKGDYDTYSGTLVISKATPSLSITIDPSTNVTYPTETTVTGIGCPTQGADDIVCKLYRNGVEVSNPDVSTLDAGTYVYVYNSTEGQNYTSATTSETLIVNRGPTEVVLYLNGTSSDRSYTYSDAINITATVNVSGLVVCLDINATGYGTNYKCNINSVTEILNASDIGLGQFNVTAHFDGNNNYLQSSDSHFITIVDVGYPVYSNVKTYPTSPATYLKDRTYWFNITWTDEVGVDTVIFEFNGVNHTANKSGNEYYYTISDLSAGTYSYKWYANDTSGNDNYYSGTYTINKATPRVTVYVNGTSDVRAYEIGTPINISATIEPSYLDVYIDTNIPDWIIQSGTGSISYTTTLPNELMAINITAYNLENQNFTSDKAYVFILLYNQSSLNIYEDQITVWTAYHPQNVSGYYNISMFNTLSIPLTTYVSATIDEGWINTTDTTFRVTVEPNEHKSILANVTARTVYEYSYIPTWAVSTDGAIKHVYVGVIKVTENETTKNYPIIYKIPKGRLDFWDNRLSNPAPSTSINGTSNGVYILGETEDGFVTLKVDTTFSTSSLYEGVWYWQLIYYTPTGEVTPPPGGGGGGGVGGIINFNIRPSSFEIKSIPNQPKTVYLEIANLETKPIYVKPILFYGDRKYWLTKEVQHTIGAKQTELIPLTFLTPEIIGKKEKLVVSILVQKDGLINKIDIPVTLEAVKGLELGERCDASKECLSGYCYKGFDELYPTCKPYNRLEYYIRYFITKPQYILAIGFIIVILYFALKK